MPEFDHDSDQLEQFFQKATNKPDVAFSEEDWKKLEERLDAADAARVAKSRFPKKTVITAVIVGAFLLSSVGIWWGSEMDVSTTTQDQVNVSTAPAQVESLQDDNVAAETKSDETSSVEQSDAALPEEAQPLGAETESASAQRLRQQDFPTGKQAFADEKVAASDQGRKIDRATNESIADDNHNESIADDSHNQNKSPNSNDDDQLVSLSGRQKSIAPLPLADGKVRNELVVSSSNFTERNKQRARIELPGAEGADQTGRQTMVEEEHVSDKKGHVARPRLSLLLSFAPDFSGTSLNEYSAPGKAFGGMLHYHLRDRWSISAGVIKNFKQYTGAGEDYTPPKGYWKYYTNGIIPETIDGSCSVLEFPIMVHYTVRDREKNRWTVGAGASSYLMQTESYRYHFSQPNPGAKDGWDSGSSSRFMFNMLNLTIGYEHQVIPGLMVGIEPYIKLPLEEIGWSNLRLYSSGASITLRYTLIGRKQVVPVTFRSRGPD